jgi:hypothetical protein
MPYVVHPRKIKRLGALMSAALVLVAALPAVAGAACPTTATTQPFKKWGDTAAYSLVTNGHFEAGTTGWSLTGSSVATGNESFKVRSSTDARSLAIQPTGLATSPAFCVGVEHPTFRFFARKTSGSWATMLVKLRWTDSAGHTNDTTVGSLDGGAYASWMPSQTLQLAQTLPLWQAGSSLSVRIMFDPENYGGAWAIDDVYIDPYRK